MKRLFSAMAVVLFTAVLCFRRAGRAEFRFGGSSIPQTVPSDKRGAIVTQRANFGPPPLELVDWCPIRIGPQGRRKTPHLGWWNGPAGGSGTGDCGPGKWE